MLEHLGVFAGVGLGLGLAMAFVQGAAAQENPVTAIDIALEPDATMVEHAMAANARLLKSFPKGFSLDETHHPHVSILQQFVRTDDLDKVFAAANAVLAKEKPTTWTLKAFKYYYIPAPPMGLAERPIEISECSGLDPIGEYAHEQPSREMGGSDPAQIVTPLEAELIHVEAGKVRDQGIDRFAL